MEERMEKFRDKIKLDNLTTAFSCFILTIFALFSAMGEAGIIPFFTPAAGDNHWQSMWRGFISGASFGILGVMVFFLIRNIRALHNDKFLKKLYIQENDERQIQIWTAARASAMRAFMILGMVSGIIAGYFSIIVGITIIACTTLQAFIGLFFALYYNYKS